MFDYNGKSYNRFGIYDSCMNQPDKFIYAIIGARMKRTQLPVVAIGLCLPSACNKRTYYKGLEKLTRDVIEYLRNNRTRTDIGSHYLSNNSSSDYSTFVEFPSEINDRPLSVGASIMIFILSIIGVLWISGLIVEFTSLFDISDKARIEDKKSKIGLFFLAFSPAYNISYIFNTSDKKDGPLKIIYGLKVIAILWILVGQSYLYIIYVPVANSLSISQIFKAPLFGMIPGALFGVDALFYLTGVLSFYLLTSEMYGNLSGVKFWKLYLKRMVRLIVPLALAQGIIKHLFTYMGDGPLYVKSWEPLLNGCDTYWWSNLIFLNNFVPWNLIDVCLPWTFYISLDFQFFLITPPLVYLYCRFRKIGFGVIYLLIIINMVYMMIITLVHNSSSTNMLGDTISSDWMFTKPFARWGTYLIGGLFGISFFELCNTTGDPEIRESLFNKYYAKVKNSTLFMVIVLFTGIFFVSINYSNFI